jgi:hypothetical protein
MFSYKKILQKLAKFCTICLLGSPVLLSGSWCCNLVEVYWHFGGSCYLHCQDRWVRDLLRDHMVLQPKRHQSYNHCYENSRSDVAWMLSWKLIVVENCMYYNCIMLDFHRSVDEVFTVLGCYAALMAVRYQCFGTACEFHLGRPSSPRIFLLELLIPWRCDWEAVPKCW